MAASALRCARFVLDTSRCESVFGAAGTPLDAAIAATVACYRTRPGTP